MNDTVETEAGRLIRGDCRSQAENIEPGSADLVLTDPPYGTVKGVGIDGWDAGTTDWDDALPPSELIRLSRYVLRKNGKAAIFAQEPYTSELISADVSDVPFSYRMIWKKRVHANALFSKSAPLKYHEDIAVFTKEYDTNETHPLRSYFAEVFEYISESKAEIIRRIGQEADHTFRHDSTQFALCTRETYQKLKQAYGIDEMDGFRPYDSLQKEDGDNVFNLPPGEKYKTDVLEYAKPHTGDHPTQKPVALLEDLIRTFTHEGDLVVDFTAGSGSTAVAAQDTGRRFIGIEKDPEHFETAVRRLKGAEPRPACGQQDLTAFCD